MLLHIYKVVILLGINHAYSLNPLICRYVYIGSLLIMHVIDSELVQSSSLIPSFNRRKTKVISMPKIWQVYNHIIISAHLNDDRYTCRKSVICEVLIAKFS